jgi:hypothetical protein
MDFNSFDISRARHWIRYSYRLAIQQSQTYQQNHLFIADFKTGEVVLHLQPDKDSVLAPSLSNGVAAVFDPTERFVALSWNSPLAFSWPPAPEKHQSQIRIYDLKAKKEVRRIELPCGSQWSVKAWEGNQLQTDRSWIESTDGTNFVNYSCINRIDLNDDPPHAVEYSTLQNSSDASQSRIVTNGADITYHQPERACVIRLHSWIFKKAAVPTAFRKIIDWFPSTKNFINDFYPETATQVSLLDQVTGKPLWDCPRLFRGSDELSPDGHSLALSFTKDDSIIVEMWDTHYPRRWLEVLGFFGVVGLWYCWRARKALRRFESSTVVRH